MAVDPIPWADQRTPETMVDVGDLDMGIGKNMGNHGGVEYEREMRLVADDHYFGGTTWLINQGLIKSSKNCIINYCNKQF